MFQKATRTSAPSARSSGVAMAKAGVLSRATSPLTCWPEPQRTVHRTVPATGTPLTARPKETSCSSPP